MTILVIVIYVNEIFIWATKTKKKHDIGGDGGDDLIIIKFWNFNLI